MTTTQMHNLSDSDDCMFCMQYMDDAALRILEPEVRARVEGHLARCSMCRDELAQIERAVLPLAFSVNANDPQPDARQKLLAAFTAERDHPPAPVTPPSPTPSRPARTRSRQIPWSYGSIFAGLAVALLIVGFWNFLPFDRDANGIPAGQYQVMAMDTTCPDCHKETGGQIGADPEEKDGLVVAWNLDPQRKHEVWCVNRGGKHTKIGDLEVKDTGSVMQTVSFPEMVGEYEQIYIIRDDGAQELTVAPGSNRSDSENSGDALTPPAE